MIRGSSGGEPGTLERSDMLSDREKRIADLALRNRYLTRAQLGECCERHTATAAPLEQILVERGYLTHEELAELDRLSGRPPLFAEIVRDRGLASESQISDALTLKDQLASRNIHRYIGQILVDRSVLSPAQVADVLAEQDRRTRRCQGCGYAFAASHAPGYACPECGRAVESGAGSGIRLGPCVLREELGQGPLGAVHRAFHEPLGREVALKVLPADAALEERARRAVGFDHPNAARVWDVRREADRLLVAADLVEGLPLYDHVVGSFRLDPREAIALLKQAAAVLDAAHRRGLVHGNLKPQNVLVTEMREVRLTDFGLWSGEIAARNASVAGDVRSLGHLWHFMLRGEPPSGAVSPRLFPGLPDLAAVLFARAVSTDPRLRYPDAAAMGVDLDHLENELLRRPEDETPEPSPPVLPAPPASRAPRPRRRLRRR